MHEAKNASKGIVLLAAIAAGAMLVAAIVTRPAINVSVPAEKTSAEQILKIEGRGEVTLSPDSLRTRISVTAREKTLEEARSKAATQSRAVVDALGRLGISGMKVRTVEITIDPVTEKRDVNDLSPPAIVGYAATSTISVALTNVSVAELRDRGAQSIETALTAGANVIGGMTFFLSDSRDARRLALAAAVEDAQKNSKTMADKAGIKLVGLKSLVGEEESFYGKSMAQSAIVTLAESDVPVVIGFPVEPGDIVISAEVRADFAFAQ